MERTCRLIFDREAQLTDGPRAVGPFGWISGEFRVEEFRVPLMRAILQPPAEPQVGVSELPVELGVQYLAGGGASNLPATLRRFDPSVSPFRKILRAIPLPTAS